MFGSLQTGGETVAMANAVNLSLLRRATCSLAKLRLTVRQHRITARRVILRFVVTAARNGHQRAVRAAAIVVDGHRLATNAHGRATITLRLDRPAHLRARAAAAGYGGARISIRIRDPARRPRRPG
jgi:hypothetical protein